MPGASTAGAETTEVLGGAFDVVREFVRNEERVVAELLRRAPETYGSTKHGFGDSRGPYRHGTPMVITTENLAAQDRYIVFWSGPSNTSWSFPMRAAQQQTRSGTIFHAWRNSSRQTFFDEPTVTFTFQAGNIMPVRVAQGRPSAEKGKVVSEAISLPAGLLDFYDFFEVLNQPKILSDGRPNFVFIAYHSLVYPEIFMRGFFNPEGIQFQENSQDPANLSWSATFKIRSTEPPFWNSQQLIASWRSAFVAEPSEDAALDSLVDELAVTGGSTAGSRGARVLGTTGVPIPGQGDGG
jgi:hypothetical protein